MNTPVSVRPDLPHLVTELPGDNGRASAITVQADGNIVVAGTEAAFNESTSTWVVVRYLGH